MEEADLSLEDELLRHIEARDPAAVLAFTRDLEPSETSLTISQLPEAEQDVFWQLLILADSDFAADLAEHFPDDYAEDLIEDMDPESAAKLLDRFDSDEQYEVLSRLDEEQSEQILERMSDEESADVERRLQYERFTAGGLMVTEILVFPQGASRDEMTRSLRDNYDLHRSYEHRYIYEVDAHNRWRGSIPMRKLVYAPVNDDPSTLYAPHIQPVQATDDLDELRSIFDRVDHSVLPVLDEEGVLVGALTRASVLEAVAKRQEEQLMQFGGVIGGEELRVMPFATRCLKRLAFLLPSILLSYIAVGVIAVFEPVVEQITTLAIFLPMVANLSGAAGNQAVAVSIRELTLGLLDKKQIGRVLYKEIMLGLINGLAIGAILGLITFVMRGEEGIVLPFVLAGAYTISSMLAVCIGGSLPLLMKRLGVDPAMLSSPILTTLTDMASFFLVLSLASKLLL